MLKNIREDQVVKLSRRERQRRIEHAAFDQGVDMFVGARCRLQVCLDSGDALGPSRLQRGCQRSASAADV